MFEKTIVTAPAKESFAQLCKAARLFPLITQGLDLTALKVKLNAPEDANPEQIRKIAVKSGYSGIINILEAICVNNSDALFEFLAACFFSTKEEVESADTLTLIMPILELLKSKTVISFFTSFTQSVATNS